MSFALFSPLMLSPIGGMVADRVDRRSVLLLTQGSLMLAMLLMATLTTIGAATPGLILALAAVEGILSAFNAPAWHALLASLVPAEAVVNAIALNSAQFNIARMVGPAIASFVIAAAGVATIFWANAGSFLAVLLALLLIRPAISATGRPAAWGGTSVRASCCPCGTGRRGGCSVRPPPSPSGGVRCRGC